MRTNPLLFTVFAVCFESFTVTAVEPFTFAQYEINTGSAKHQTVLSGFFFEGPIADLAIVKTNGTNRRLHIYSFRDSTWVQQLNVELRPQILFVDVLNIGGHDRLVTYEPGRINWFDAQSETEKTLVMTPSNFTLPRKDIIPHVDISSDLNDDRLDDLVLPDEDGFWVFIQLSDATFANPVKIGPYPNMRTISSTYGYRYTPWAQSRIHKIDYNRDGRSDLVYWNKNRFEVHLQNQKGLFAPNTTSFTTDVFFSSDDSTTLVAPYGVRRRRKDHQPTGNLTGRVLHSLSDHNGDGIADLVIFSLRGGSLWGMHSAYEVHLGSPTPNGIVFSPEVSTAVYSDGIPFGLMSKDIDDNSQMDVIYTVINPGIFKVVGMLIGGLVMRSIAVDLHFYPMQNSTYPAIPHPKQKIRTISLGKSGERTNWPSVLIGDMNGDKRSDLLVQNGRKELQVFSGIPEKGIFSKRPQKVAVDVPNEEYTWLANLNKDNQQDIIMHHPSTTHPHRVILLIAQ